MSGIFHVLDAIAAVFFLVLGGVNLTRALHAEVNDQHADEDGFDSAGVHVLANAFFLGLGAGLMVAFTFIPR